MELKNIERIVKLSAGNKYDIESVNEKCVTAVHRKCGNRFTCTIDSVAMHGFLCNRCDDTSNINTLDTLKVKASAEIYTKCVTKLPEGFSVYGDTSDITNTITVSYPGIDTFDIVISDLLSNTNLPDCLLHRDTNLIPSVQLQIVDMILQDNLEILDDFENLSDFVRVKDNQTLAVTHVRVSELIGKVLMAYDKN